MSGILDRKLPKNLLIAVDDLVCAKYLGLTENSSLVEFNWCFVDLKSPVLGSLHLLKHLSHLFDLFNPLLGTDLTLRQCIAHVWALADAFWYVREETALRWKVYVLTICPYTQEWLVEIFNLHVVHLLEVLTNADLLTFLIREHAIAWVQIEIDGVNDVGLLGSPVGHDAFSGEFLVDSLPPTVIVTDSLLKLIHVLQASFG